jgi:Ca2+-binding RTX toxin-like protein
VISGGAGRDKMKGDAGSDTFVFDQATDSAVNARDRIKSFETGIDHIDLSAMDANTLIAGDQAFAWANGPAGPGALWLIKGNLYGDLDGDGIADFRIDVGKHLVHDDVML